MWTTDMFNELVASIADDAPARIFSVDGRQAKTQYIRLDTLCVVVRKLLPEFAQKIGNRCYILHADGSIKRVIERHTIDRDVQQPRRH